MVLIALITSAQEHNLLTFIYGVSRMSKSYCFIMYLIQMALYLIFCFTMFKQKTSLLTALREDYTETSAIPFPFARHYATLGMVRGSKLLGLQENVLSYHSSFVPRSSLPVWAGGGCWVTGDLPGPPDR